MKKRTRRISRLLATALILAVSLTLFPVSGTDTAAPAAELVSTEVLSLREENVKHFAVGNNTYQAVAYGHPVHKLDENGNWVDIDNSLTLSGSSYATEDGRVSFAQSFTPNQNLMTLQEDGSSVSMALLAEPGNQMTTQPMSFASVSNPQNSILTAEDAMNAVFSSTVTYENALPDTDLEYTVDAGSVKEYIVVNEPQTSYAYHFALTLSGLTAQLEEDGSVGLYTAENEKKYTIPAPYMFDAAGSFSEAVAYTLLGESGKYFLTVTADAAWLNDPARVWPVKIDPTIAVTSDAEDTYIDSQYATANYGSAEGLKVGSGKNAYFKMPDFSVPDGSRVILAYLRLYYYFGDGVTAGSDTIGVYQMLNSWNENTLTWNTFSASTKGSASTATATKTFYGSAGATAASPLVTDFDILDIVSAWQSGSTNYGVALKRISGSHSEMYFCSNEYGVMFRPRIVYQYQDIPVYVYKSYYDDSFEGMKDLIPNVVAAANVAFSSISEIGFDEDGVATNENSYTVDNAGYFDFDVISEALYGEYTRTINPLPNNYRTILWTDYPLGFYQKNLEALDSYAGVQHTANVHLPVIIIMNLGLDNFNNVTDDQYEAAMGILLLHETAHTFDLPETYDDDNAHSAGTYNCVMEYYGVPADTQNGFVDFYNSIADGTEDAFCENCTGQLRACIQTHLNEIAS